MGWGPSLMIRVEVGLLMIRVEVGLLVARDMVGVRIRVNGRVQGRVQLGLG